MSDEPEVIRIPPLAFFKTMLLIIWCSLRHPFKTTVIDAATGRIVSQG